MPGLHKFRVLWGQLGRPGFVTEVIEAWDREDALALAADLHPELHRPHVAVLATSFGPGSPTSWNSTTRP